MPGAHQFGTISCQRPRRLNVTVPPQLVALDLRKWARKPKRGVARTRWNVDPNGPLTV
jgi:hypothetical protein